MTIQKAIKNADPFFKRKHWGVWLWIDNGRVMTYDIRHAEVELTLREENILSDDWEVSQ